MSGLLEEVVTPCPSRSSRGNDSFSYLWEDGLDSGDETANLKFTTEIKPPVLTRAKPKRSTRGASSFQVHEDSEKPMSSTTKPRMDNGKSLGTANHKSSLLSQPAQRFRPKVSLGPSPLSASGLKEPGPKTKDSGLDAMKNKDLLMQINGKECDMKPEGLNVRHDTVYMPTDDTTVASVFMGLFSPLKSQTTNSTNAHIPKDPEIDSLEARIARKRQAKKSFTSSARKAPLQPSTKIAQEASIRVDVAGKNGGKENTPPGSVIADGKDKGYKDVSLFEQPKAKQASNVSKVGRSRAGESGKVNAPRRAALGDKSNTKPSINSQSKGVIKPKPIEKSQPSLRISTLPKPEPSKKMIPSKLASSTANVKKLNEEFPPLTEDIPNLALYEDNWLSHQEIIITQLLNGLFEQADGHASSDNSETLRQELLDHYHNESFILLHKRVQASVSYGAMSIPGDVVARNSRLTQDLGLKRRFMDIWTKNYDLRALRASLETVIGRRISKDDAAVSNEKILKKKLEGFLEMFLLRNEDMKRPMVPGKEADTASRAYRRTILRSIMITVLLDKARVCPNTMLPRLFVTSSPLKSSAAVLQALARLLLPSGDIIKSLGHLDCQVSYEQGQLQEYDYRIGNLTVDVRDGVRLTRIAELLLYSHAQLADAGCATLPEKEQSPLSPHLKLPCTSRAVKLFNVQIALNALSARGTGVHGLVHDVAAEDIVDGHQEKTIALLWRLVISWGLSGLVGWDDRQEIGRLRKAVSQFDFRREQISDGAELDEHEQDHDEYVVLLKQWASLLAQLRGLRLENFSTSFADSRIYEAIVEEYQGYVLGNVECSGNLASRLRTLGCSPRFGTLSPSVPFSHWLLLTNVASLVTPNTPHTLNNSTFTLGALAFLCSGLLPASKRARAATVVQRAWRQFLHRRDASRRG